MMKKKIFSKQFGGFLKTSRQKESLHINIKQLPKYPFNKHNDLKTNIYVPLKTSPPQKCNQFKKFS